MENKLQQEPPPPAVFNPLPRVALDDIAIPITEEPSPERPRNKWTTELCECQRDEETCWWGCWCNYLLQVRTAQQFEAGTSRKQMVVYWTLWLASFVSLLANSFFFAFIFMVGGAFYLLWNRISVRGKIRRTMGIPGSDCDDCCSQCFCSCCANCQEAREAKLYPAAAAKYIDFCSGEDLTDAEEKQQRAIGHVVGGNDGSVHSPGGGLGGPEDAGFADPNIPEGGNVWSHMKLVSKTSKIILLLWLLAAGVSFYIVSAVQKQPENIGILLLVFVQPFMILYVVYWRTRRQYVSLDYVIKCFAVGFWLTPFQAIVFESLSQTLIALAFIPLLGSLGSVAAILAVGSDDQLPDDAFPDTASQLGSSLAGNLAMLFDVLSSNGGSPSGTLLPSRSNFGALLRRGVGGIARRMSLLMLAQYEGIQPPQPPMSYIHPAFNGLPTFQTFQNSTMSGYLSPHANSTARVYGAGAGDDGMPTTVDTLERVQLLRLLLQKNLFWVLLLLFLNAFVVAAGVEETMKHFVVRCCSFPAGLKDPQSVLVYLVAGALGFATAENIEYVFGSGEESAVPGASIFVGELMVLLMRVLMPVHVICSVMQATNLSKVLMGQTQMSLFRVRFRRFAVYSLPPSPYSSRSSLALHSPVITYPHVPPSLYLLPNITKPF